MARTSKSAQQPEPLPPRLDEATILRMVFETFDRRRFLQDSPIRPDVWSRAIAIADRTARWRIERNEGEQRQSAGKSGMEAMKREKQVDGRGEGQPDDRIDVLITPVSGVGAGVVAERLRELLNKAPLDYQEPPPGPTVLEALVRRHMEVPIADDLGHAGLADAFARVAAWANLAEGDAQTRLYERTLEPLYELLPDRRWETVDDLRVAMRYALQKVVGDANAPELFGQRQQIAQGMREVVARLSFPEIYRFVLPLTAWWQRLPRAYRDGPNIVAAIREEMGRPNFRDITVAQFVSSRPSPEYYRVSALATFVMALYDCADRDAYVKWREIVKVLAPTTPRQFGEDEALFDPDAPVDRGGAPVMGDARIVRLLDAYSRMAPPLEPREDGKEAERCASRKAGAKGIIWAIQCNRRALIAEVDDEGENRPSHATIKADAARRLFGISTSRITWAVIDTGIDLRHAAFRTSAWTKEEPTTRIERVLDFALLRAIMSERVLPHDLPSWPQDGTADAGKLQKERLAILKGIDFVTQRNRLARDLDWNIVAPLVERPARATDERWTAPTHDHGTHVAGILAGDWHVRRESPVTVANVQSESGKLADAEDAAAQVGKEVRIAGLQPEGEALVARVQSPTKSGKSYAAGLRAGEDEEIFVGVCPQLRLIDLRVFGDDRSAVSEKGMSAAGAMSTEYAILAAIEYIGWLNRTHETPVVHGVNLSVAVPHRVDAYACGQTPVCRACNSLSAAGTVVVAAAGNTGFDIEAGKLSRGEGYRDISISDPGNAEEVITVGATHARDPHTYGVSYFSGRGPTGDGRRKPDLVAPGERIVSTILWAAGDDIEDPEPGYESERLDCKDGTSMAAPHVSGAAALLMARYPELVGHPRRIKQILMQTATDLGRDPVFQGAGLVDVLRALQSV